MQLWQSMNENRDFRRAYGKGKSLVDPILVTYAVKSRSRTAGNHIGITATKKVGKACKRNRARRIIREAYRQLAPTVPKGYDIVFVARTRTCSVKMQDVLRVMKRHIATLLKPQQ